MTYAVISVKLPFTKISLIKYPSILRFFAPIQTGPRAHPAYCTMGTGSFLGVKAAGA